MFYVNINWTRNTAMDMPERMRENTRGLDPTHRTTDD